MYSAALIRDPALMKWGGITRLSIATDPNAMVDSGFLVQNTAETSAGSYVSTLSSWQYGGPLEAKFFFQNAHSSGVATDVESKIPPNQTDIGPHKKSHQG